MSAGHSKPGGGLSDRPQCGANVVNRQGKRYGRLLVLERVGSRPSKRGASATWLCLCDCGKRKVVSADAFRSGTRSCGCSRATGKGSRPYYTCRLPPGEAAKRYLRKQYKGAAKKRGLAWGLDDETFYALLARLCFYCGAAPHRVRKVSRNGETAWNGIDRVDNAAGYVPGNVVPCCHVCNHAKCDLSQAEFIAWIGRAASHLGVPRTTAGG